MSYAERPDDVGSWTPSRVIHLARAADVDFVVELVNRLPDYEALYEAVDRMFHADSRKAGDRARYDTRAALARLREPA